MIWPLFHLSHMWSNILWSVWGVLGIWTGVRLCARAFFVPTAVPRYSQMHTGPDCLCLACNDIRAEIARDNTSPPPSGYNGRYHMWSSAPSIAKDDERDVDI